MPKRTFRPVLNGTIPAAVQAAVVDPARVTPMLLGASCIRPSDTPKKQGHGQLIVRTATADIEVLAPIKLLNQVFDSCDGTRTLTEVLALLPDATSRDEMAAFIEFLFQQGALIDGSLACAHTLRLGYQFSPFGLAAEPDITAQIARRFQWSTGQHAYMLHTNIVRVPHTPLDSVLSARFTQYTFDDTSLPAHQLHQLLWSFAGVVSTKHPRAGFSAPQRTLASGGGMHLLKVYVALQRKVGRWVPGIYEVHYPQARTIALTKLPSDIDELPLAFGKPWHLTFATGAVFIAADPTIAATRYRNRSLQYLFMEAGAALHNGGLTCAALGLGYATIGGYYERPASRLCCLGAELLLGAAIFGAQAKPEQLRLLAAEAPIDFAWVNGEASRLTMGFHLARAKIKDEQQNTPYTWGRDVRPAMAMRKAIAEAIERDGYQQPSNVRKGIMADIPGALNPRDFVRYTASQYGSPDFPYAPFQANEEYAWVLAKNLITAEPVALLADLVFTHHALTTHGHAASRPYTQVTSSGCAAGTSPRDATLRALLELIERDAFMRHWFSQSAGTVIPAELWPEAITRRVQSLLNAGCRVAIYRLGSPWAHVALVGAQHRDLHFTTLGACASHSFTQAASNALDEAETRVYAWLHGHACTIERPEDVTTVEHHFELYGLKRYFKRADRVLFPNRPDQAARWPRAQKDQGIEPLTLRMIRSGLRPVAIDITPRLHHIDQGRTPLFVTRAWVPGLVPLSFGAGREALGMVSGFHPGSQFPHPFP